MQIDRFDVLGLEFAPGRSEGTGAWPRWILNIGWQPLLAPKNETVFNPADCETMCQTISILLLLTGTTEKKVSILIHASVRSKIHLFKSAKSTKLAN